MTPDDVTRKLSLAVQDIANEAGASGILVGGTLNVLELDPSAAWVRRAALTIRRAGGDTSVIPAVRPLRPLMPAGAALSAHATQPEPEIAQGETCMTCGGARLQRAGACLVCLDCGTAGGCG